MEVRYADDVVDRCWPVTPSGQIIEATLHPVDEPISRAAHRIIAKDEWVGLSRKLLERSSRCFNLEERRAISGFINFVADDVEQVQQQGGPNGR